MIDEKWNAFMNSGKISDYLEYKKSAEQSAAETGGEANENGGAHSRSSRLVRTINLFMFLLLNRE